MKKEISLKDLLTVDPTDGSYDYDPDGLMVTAYKRRKRPAVIDEELTVQQRVARRNNMRRLKGRLKAGRKRASKRRASTDVLRTRARRAARAQIAKRLLGGKSKGEVSYAARARVEKALSKQKNLINSLAAKLMTQIRKQEASRFNKK